MRSKLAALVLLGKSPSFKPNRQMALNGKLRMGTMLQKVMPPWRKPASLWLLRKRLIWRITVCWGKGCWKAASVASSCQRVRAFSSCCRACWSLSWGRNKSAMSWRTRSAHVGISAGVCHRWRSVARVRIRAVKRLSTAIWLGSLCHALMFCHSLPCLSGSSQPNIRRSKPCCQVNKVSPSPRISLSKPQWMLSWAMVSCRRGRSSRVSSKRCNTVSLSNRGNTLSTSKRLSSRLRVCSKA